jgi:DNA-binding response OmpR family regulator
MHSGILNDHVTGEIVMERPSGVITIGPIRFDTLRQEVSRDDKTVRLTPVESKVLHFLAMNVNNVCTASQIIVHVWGRGFDDDQVANLLKVYIRYIRHKIEPDPMNPTYILTIPQSGYKLVMPDGSKHP